MEIKKHSLAILVDPEKAISPSLRERVGRVRMQGLDVDYVLLGGSTGALTDETIFDDAAALGLPVVLFPGNATQLSARADGMLLPVVISGRNAEMLIGQHVKAAREIRALGVPVLPMGYMLLDGGKLSSAVRMSETTPISQLDRDLIVRTAMAGEILGLKAIYLEAGSGALQPVGAEVIRAVRETIALPLIVGGGLRTREAIEAAWANGADMVVIGNALEG